MFDYQRVYGNLMKFMEHMQNMEIMMVSQSKICIEKKTPSCPFCKSTKSQGTPSFSHFVWLNPHFPRKTPSRGHSAEDKTNVWKPWNKMCEPFEDLGSSSALWFWRCFSGKKTVWHKRLAISMHPTPFFSRFSSEMPTSFEFPVFQVLWDEFLGTLQAAENLIENMA